MRNLALIAALLGGAATAAATDGAQHARALHVSSLATSQAPNILNVPELRVERPG
jgi:hypothetical protein